MKQPHELIYDRIHDIQQRLEQRFEQTGIDETEPFYKHRFVAELLEDIKGIAEKNGDGVEPAEQIDKLIDSQFWDLI
jgi:hypothetical protein